MNHDLSVIFRARKGLIWLFILVSFMVIGMLRDLYFYLICR